MLSGEVIPGGCQIRQKIWLLSYRTHNAAALQVKIVFVCPVSRENDSSSQNWEKTEKFAEKKNEDRPKGQSSFLVGV